MAEKADTAVRHLEDFAVGQRFASGSQRLTAEEIKRYATQYDPQPFHMDEEAAQDSMFQGLAASGWNTLGVTMRLLVEGPVRPAGGLIGAGAEVEWPRPTRPDDVLSVESEVLEVTPFRSKPDRGLVRLRTETRNQKGELLLVFTAKLIVPRRPGGTGDNGARDGAGSG
ncbi:MaoC family dehydratase [Azorhizobium oxalatiphilum]|uniref:MaoC family dehydratase n=1 Tax=Azorhizobium oxalatiphilum TaxID=980631 RepID=A0A917C5M5_9HYPH|nr:MaoC family dehydratase [Azorhizobium oxalatiphilum]GGF71200.1 MaoC family dehydratase [Azorhizobium oxalatiphilum]